ncbi:unnamed protein product, partial [Gulo gulo]
ASDACAVLAGWEGCGAEEGGACAAGWGGSVGPRAIPVLCDSWHCGCSFLNCEWISNPSCPKQMFSPGNFGFG